MKHYFLIILSFILFSFFSCNKDNEITNDEKNTIIIKKLVGVAQKGPFNIGSDILISELDTNFAQTGRNFTSQISNNTGSFEIENLSIVTSCVLLRVDGFYFNEFTGENSEERLMLYSISDLTNQNTINVNILSHIEKPRIEYLIGQGKTFAEAKKQAQKEVLEIFEMGSEEIENSEQLDLSQNGEGNSVLLAISLILQGRRNVSELSSLLANLSLDVKTDGVISNMEIGSQLINDISTIDLISVRKNIESKYIELGTSFSIPNFESKVKQFIDSADFKNTQSIIFPEEGKYGPNLLFVNDGDSIVSPKHYSIKAFLPEGFKLKVKVKQTSPLYYDDPANSNWFYGTLFIGEISSFNTKAIEIGNMEWSSKENVTVAENRISFEGIGSAIMELYKNDSLAPFKSVNFNWYVPSDKGITYPQNGLFGTNILAQEDNSLLKSGDTYSLAANLESDMNFFIDIKISKISGSGDFNFDNKKRTGWNLYKSENSILIFGNLCEPAYEGDIPITFSGSGECLVEIIVRNGNLKRILLKHLKWE